MLTLVENAVRHGIDPSENGGRIEVGARHEPDGDIRVVVADTGAGMSPSAVPGTGLTNLESGCAASSAPPAGWSCTRPGRTG